MKETRFGWGLVLGLLVVAPACGADATAGAELGADTSLEVEPDVGPDVTPEVEPDVAPEVEPDVAPEVEPDVTPAEYGLDDRPSVGACTAFERPTLAPGGEVAYAPAFPNMDFGGQAIGLVRTRIGPDGPMRWFVLDREGEIWTFISDAASKDGLAADDETPVERAEVYLELPETPYGTGGEGGLLGFTFDPDFAVDASQNYVYVHYTTWPNNNVWRFRIDGSGGADPFHIAESKRIFVTESGGGNHWGGDLEFGPDRYLYISLGDGGNGMSSEDAVLTTWLRGKILRIDPRSPAPDVPYVIPPDNPFAGGPICDDRDLSDNTVACPEIFARGFRNPWRMNFDRATGHLWVGDVGSGKEEVNLVLAGNDYGWNRCDGRNPRNSCPPIAAASALIAPVAQYRHYNSASVAGGVVYHGQALGAALQGAYLFTDVYNGELLVIDAPYANVTFDPFRVTDVLEHPDESDDEDLPRFRKLDAPTLSWPVSWAEDENAEVYVVTFGAGKGEGVMKLVLPTPEVVDDTVPATLSATGCVLPEDPEVAAPGLIAYDLNAPFWSDGAEKSRWLAVPDAAAIDIGEGGDWDLPPGSIVMKTFRLGGRPVETRLMVRHDGGGWAGYTYVWRADGGDADKANPAGETRVWGDQPWLYPSRAGCMGCHTVEAGFTLGLETRQLDRLHAYVETGRSANQIATLAHIGLIPPETDPDPGAAFVDPFGDAALERRARTYLHANCQQCHHGGRVPDLRYDTTLADTELCIDSKIVPGDPGASRLVQRMLTEDPTLRMPRGAGLVVDQAGVDLLSAWIAQLTSCESP